MSRRKLRNVWHKWRVKIISFYVCGNCQISYRYHNVLPLAMCLFTIVWSLWNAFHLNLRHSSEMPLAARNVIYSSKALLLYKGLKYSGAASCETVQPPKHNVLRSSPFRSRRTVASLSRPVPDDTMSPFSNFLLTEKQITSSTPLRTSFNYAILTSLIDGHYLSIIYMD